VQVDYQRLNLETSPSSPWGFIQRKKKKKKKKKKNYTIIEFFFLGEGW